MKNNEIQQIVNKINSLPVEKQRALIFHLRKQGIDILPFIEIPKSTTEEDDDIQLSFAQQRLWFLEKLEGNSAYYNIPEALCIEGQLNKVALFRAIGEIIKRHSILRTRFIEKEGVTYQVIDKVEEEFYVEEEEVSTDNELKVLCEEEAVTPFDLSKDKLIRLRLFKREEDKHILMINMHHSVSDGWSLGIFFDELEKLYSSYCRCEQSNLKPLKIQYSDYASWQSSWLTGAVKEKQLSYWKEQLGDVNGQLVLPADNPRPAVKTYNGAHEQFLCPSDLLSELHKLSDKEGVTLYITLLSAFLILMWNYTNETDIVIGTPTANRNRLEVENLIGLFVNTVVLRNDLSGNYTFKELLSKVKTTALEAFSHQDIPFESVVDSLDLERSMSYSPLFQIMFVLQEPLTRFNSKLGDLNISEVDYDFKIAKYDLTLDLRETVEGLCGTIEYNSDLFKVSTIKRLGNHYLNLLKQVVLNPKLHLSEYQCMSEEEKNQILVKWNTTVNYKVEKCMHEIFETSCEIAQDKIAVVCGDEKLTYRELNEKANQVAHYLISIGIKADDLVCIYLERSVDIIVATLGILKAGAGYVPIDSSYPTERVSYILEDSNAVLMLTKSNLESNLPSKDMRIVCLDKYDFSNYDKTNIPVSSIGLKPNNIEYVIYTSGSTGKPKGVLVEHRNVVRLFVATNEEFGFNSNDVWTMFHSNAFDFSVWEMWGALLFGGRLVIVPRLIAQSLDEFYSLIVKEKVTVLNQTPTVFEQLIAVDEARREELSLRYVVFGGETLKPAILKPWFYLHGDEKIKLINMYGITETTVHVTYYHLRKEDIELSQKSTIGKKLKDLILYVLNDNLSPVPIGVTGRMFVGGGGVTRGYLNRPEVTNERFIKDIFSDIEGARLYDTGDLARWLPDGTIEYIGRCDDQVKIRGFRIELGEIESQLLKNPTVEACCVMVREDIPNNKKIIAYIVSNLNKDGDKISYYYELNTYIQPMLPNYMIPSAYVLLDSLPVTSNGKINRKALPKPNIDSLLTSSYVVPRTNKEVVLVKILSELLELDEGKIGIRDNFFALGGHSLLITKLLAALRKYGLSCKVVTVFTAQTIEELAKLIEDDGVEQGFKVPNNIIPDNCERIIPSMLPLVELSQDEIDVIVSTVEGGVVNIQDIYPLVPSQEGILFHHMLEPGKDPYVIPALFQVDSKEQLNKFIDAIQATIDRHDALRTCIVVDGLLKPVQVVCRKAKLLVETLMIDDEIDAEEYMRNKLVQLEFMDIAKAPLVGLKVCYEAEGDKCYAILYMHHLIEDATSLNLIFEEIMAHLSSQKSLAKAESYRSFVAYTLHQIEKYDAEEYFTKKLCDVSETTAPFGLYDIQGDGSNINSIRCLLQRSLGDEIRSIAKELHISSASIFHVAWALLVSICSSHSDVVFGTVLSGRLQGVRGIEKMIGNFINTLPIRFSLEGKSIAEAVREADKELKELINYEQTSLIVAQNCSAIGKNSTLFTSVINYRHFENFSNEYNSYDIRKYGIKSLDVLDRNNYPMGVSIDDLGNDFSLNIQVNESESTESIFSYMEEALKGIIKAILEDKAEDTPILDIDIVPDAEAKLQLVDWNQTENQHASKALLHELFEAQANKNPKRIALEFKDEVVTYGELNKRANKLAHYLRKQGVVPDTLVVLCLNRSIEMIVVILGILKAGGAYVPIDPDYPKERIRYILRDSNSKIIITNKHLSKDLPVDNQLMIYMDKEKVDELFGNLLTSNLDKKRLKVTPNNLAYVIYTSGSTGRPKGVLVEHKGVVRIITSPDYFTADEHTVMLKHMSISFDVGSQEVLIPLLNGGKLVIFDGDSRCINGIVDYIEKKDVNMMSLSAAFLPALADAIKKHKVGLKYLGIGGDSFSARDVRSIYDSIEDIKIFNAYGPTENSIASTCYEIPRDIDYDSIIPIGKPIAETEAYVLDESLRALPIGVIGELCVGGIGVARGYLNNERLTKERFIDNPFSNKVGDKLYRTGDLVRWNSKGELEFIGRVDDQVKVRGYRIELREIENVLVTHKDVNNAVVSTQLVGEDNRLVSYICPTDECLDNIARNQYKESLEHWTQVFDVQYGDIERKEEEQEQSLVGWNSSYTGKEIPENQMIEWVSGTVNRIKALKPKKLLEIGCGTGLLLFGYADVCEEVKAVDISEPVLSIVQKKVDSQRLNHVHLSRGDALNLDRFYEDNFDVIVINSVVQYFPSAIYLEEVIKKALRCIKPGGKIFIGDVRNLDLFKEHLCSVKRCQIDEAISYESLTSHIFKRQQQETELLVSPSFFINLGNSANRINNVDIMVKRGIGDNEMISYRYDVIITAESAEAKDRRESSEIKWFNFENVQKVYSMIKSNIYNTFGISGFVNGRIYDDVSIVDKVFKSTTSGMIDPIYKGQRLTNKSMEQIEELNKIINFAEENGYYCESTWSQDDAETLDIIFGKDKLPQIKARSPYTEKRFTNCTQILKLGENLSKDLKNFLSKKLPDYMVPSTYLVLETLPVTINGKVNKLALPKADNFVFAKAEYVKPTNPTEEAICKILEKLINVEKVGMSDNFFDLGGHSLIAVRVVSNIKQILGKDAPLKAIFECKTIKELAKFIEAQTSSTGEIPLIPTKRTKEGVPLSLEQEELWFLHSGKDYVPCNENVLTTYKVKGNVNRDSLNKSVKKVVARHEILRTSFINVNGELRQIVNSSSEFKIEFRNIESEASFLSICKDEKHNLFDRHDEYLFRFTWVELTSNEHYIIISRPWGVFDGSSTTIVITEIMKLYQDFVKGTTSTLKAPAIQYSDYTIWQEKSISKEKQHNEENYWSKALENCSGSLNLFYDFDVEDITTSKADTLGVSLDFNLVEDINNICQEYGTTLYIVLLSAYVMMLRKHSNSNNICVGSPVSTRPNDSLDDVVGYFVNVIAMSIGISENMTYLDLISKIKEIATEAYTNKNIPFTRIYNMLSSKRDIKNKSLYDVMFNLIRMSSNNETSEELTMVPIEVQKEVSNCQLNLVLYESDSKITGTIEYNTNLFKETTVQNMIDEFKNILKVIVKDPKENLADILRSK